jgi:hypothetical protein
MRKIIVPVAAASLIIAGIAVPAASASAAFAVRSPACVAATNTATQDEAAYDAAHEKLANASADEQALEDYIGLEDQKSDLIQEIAQLSSRDSIAEKTLDSLGEAATSAIFAGGSPIKGLLTDVVVYGLKIMGAKNELENVETRLQALQPQLAQAESENDPPGALKGQVDELKRQAATAYATWQAAGQAASSVCQGPPVIPVPAASGSGQYYDNGVTFAEGVYSDGSSQYGVPVGGSVTPQYACTTVESTLDSSGALDGTDPNDIGTTEADQAEWLSGCVAGATADLNGTQSQAPTGSPAAAESSPTTPMATDPAPTASPSTGDPATMPSAAPSGTGSTQQYYQNGAAFAKDNEGTLAANAEGAVTDAGVSACSAVASSSPGAGMAGGEDTDTGPTAADQAAWISGCAANYTGTGTSTTDPASPATPAQDDV